MLRYISVITITLLFCCGTFAQNLIVSGGAAFSVALSADGTVYTWGANESGQLGRNTGGADDPTPASVSLSVNIQMIDAGSAAHVIALDCNGEVWTWGNNEYGQLGNTSTVSVGGSSSTPVHVKNTDGTGFLSGVKYVTSSTTASYAILAGTGNVVAWGAMTTTPGTYTGGLAVAGQNQGEIGNGTFQGSTTPTYVLRADNGQPLTNIVAIDAGDEHCFALDASGNVWAWGGNEYCDPGNCQPGVELGTGDGLSHRQNRARKVVTQSGAALSGITMITSGDTHGLFLKSDGTLWSVGGDWGPGQRGNTTGYDWQAHALLVNSGEQKYKGDNTGIDTLKGVTYISAGQQTSWAVVDIDGDGLGYLMAWGANTISDPGAASLGTGALGRGNAARVFPGSHSDGEELPVYVYSASTTLLDNVIAVSDGDGVCYVEVLNPTTRVRELYVFGNNNHGQLGTGDKIDRKYPTKPNLVFDIAEPCPEVVLEPDAVTMCPTESITLDALTYGKDYHYIWEKDGVQFGVNDTSKVDETQWTFDPIWDKPVQTFTGPGIYKVTAVDNRSIKVCDNQKCLASTDQIEVIAPIQPIDTLETLYCPDAGNMVDFEFTSNYAAGGSFNIYKAQTGGSALSTVNATNNTSVNAFSVNVSNTTAAIADSVWTVWLEDATVFPGAINNTCTPGTNNGNANTTYALYEIFADVTIKSVDIYLQSWWGAQNGTVTPTIHSSRTDANPGIGEVRNVLLWTGATTNVSYNATASLHTIPINYAATAGTKIWLKLNYTGVDQILECTNNPGFPVKDNLDANTVWFSKYDKAGNGTTYNNYGMFKNLQFERSTTYTCGRIPLAARKYCPPCTRPSNVTLSVNPADSSLCAGESAALTTNNQAAASGFEFLWYRGDTTGTRVKGPTEALNDNYSVAYANAGLYTLVVRDKDNPFDKSCHKTDQVTVVALNAPTYSISGGGSFCEDAPVTNISVGLTGAGPWNLYYKFAGTSGATVVNTSPYAFPDTTTGTFTLDSIRDANCPGAVTAASATITINSLPNVVFSQPPSLCTTTPTMALASYVSPSGAGGVFSGGAYVNSSGTFTHSGANTYNVIYTYTDANSCVEDDTATITVNSTLTPVFKGDTILCVGESAWIKALGGDSYEWNDGSTNDSILAAPDVNTIYTVTATNTAGCKGQSDVTVVVNTLPVVAVENDSVCPGTPATLTASGASSYLWNTTHTGASLTVSPGVTMNYTVTGTDGNQCSNKTTGVVYYYTPPTLNAGSDMPTCKTETATLAPTSNATWSYTWASTQGGLFDNDNAIQPVVSFNNPGVLIKDSIVKFFLLVTDTNNCSAIDSVNVAFEFDCRPYIYIVASKDSICIGESVDISSTYSTTKPPATWQWSQGAPFADDDGGPFTVSPAITTIYYATITDISGKTNYDSVVVKVNPLPTPSHNGPLTICSGYQAALQAYGGVSYKWAPGNFTTNPNTVSPVVSTTYTVTVTNQYGCSDTTKTWINTTPIPTAVTSADTTVCAGSPANIRASGGLTYNWSGIGAGFSQTVNPGSSSTYTVTVTDATGCTDDDSVVVTVEPIPIPVITGDLDICAGETTQLTAGGGVGYLWDDASTVQARTVTPAADSTFSVTAISPNLCIAGTTATVTVHPIPVISFSANTPGGCIPTTITFNDDSQPALVSWSWNLGDGTTSNMETPTHTYTTAGVYDIALSGMTAAGCASTDTANQMIEIFSLPLADFTWSPATPSNLYPTVTFNNLSQDATSYDWNFGDAATVDNLSSDKSPVHDFSTSGYFNVKLSATNDYNCGDEIEKVVFVKAEFVMYIPKAFTPNQDDLNEQLKVVLVGYQENSFEMHIYDRWGERIFESGLLSDTWDGTAKKGQKACPSGVYSWVVRFRDLNGETHKKTGVVSLIR